VWLAAMKPKLLDAVPGAEPALCPADGAAGAGAGAPPPLLGTGVKAGVGTATVVTVVGEAQLARSAGRKTAGVATLVGVKVGTVVDTTGPAAVAVGAIDLAGVAVGVVVADAVAVTVAVADCALAPCTPASNSRAAAAPAKDRTCLEATQFPRADWAQTNDSEPLLIIRAAGPTANPLP
jgi:hypothetical protein